VTKAEIVVETYAQWARYRSDLLRIEARCFGPNGDSDEDLEQLVKESLFLAVIRNGDQRAFGYCLVEKRWPETAYLAVVAIDPAYQDKGHLGKLIDAVETELRACAYTHFEINARIANGYADKIAKHYGDRVEVSYDHGSGIGPLRFFRIRL